MITKQTQTLNERPGLQLANPEAVGTGKPPVWQLVWRTPDEGPDATEPPIPQRAPRGPCPGTPGKGLIARPDQRRRGQVPPTRALPVPRRRGDHPTTERRTR